MVALHTDFFVNFFWGVAGRGAVAGGDSRFYKSFTKNWYSNGRKKRVK